jgi:hypothetical protein
LSTNVRKGEITMDDVAVEEKTEFKFSELSERAKQKAREAYIDGVEFDAEYTIDDAETVLGFLGFSIDDRQVRMMNGKTRGTPDVYYNAGWGHHWVAFNGNWRAFEVNNAGLLDYAGGDEIKKLGAKAMAVFLRYPNARADVKRSPRGESMSIENAVPDPDADDSENPEAFERVEADLNDLLEEVEAWFSTRLSDEYDYQMDYERADEYYNNDEDVLFDEDGEEL